MANVKITELTALTNPASSDVLPIVDVGADETKKVTIADLLENAGSGTASAPAFSFDSDPDTGMLRSGANALGFATGGTQRLVITSSGELKIGGTLPSSPNITLNANGTATFGARITSDRSTDGYAFEADYNSSLRGGIYASSTGASLVLKDSSGTTNISLDGSNGSATFAGDIETTTAGDGVILKSPNGTRYRLTVANDGTLSTSAV